MLDGHYGARLNRMWEFFAALLVRSGWSPNAVTWSGLALLGLGAAAYCVHHNGLVFGLWVAFAFAFDGLDGAVARLTGRATKYGGYLDAVADRYQELIVLASIAVVNDLWPAAFLVITGSFLTSYNKARVALEIAVDNAHWPDLLERLERSIFIVVLLVLDGVLPVVPGTAVGSLSAGLVVLGVLAHATALQRFVRARNRIVAAEARAST